MPKELFFYRYYLFLRNFNSIKRITKQLLITIAVILYNKIYGVLNRIFKNRLKFLVIQKYYFFSILYI